MELSITDFGFDGEGVGKVDQKVCFVRFALVGERVEVEPCQTHAKFLKAKLVKVITPSNRRVAPPCPYFARCGGCDFQHISYQDELALKKQILQRQLQKLGQNPSITVQASGQEYHYRNKVKLFASNGLAFHSAYGQGFVKIDKCLIAKPQINQTIAHLSKFLEREKLFEKIKYVEIKQIEKTILINLFVSKTIAAGFQNFLSTLGCRAKIFQTEGKKTSLLASSDCFEASSPNSFHQVNDQVAELLYQKVCSLAKGKTIANCYSGAGLLSKMLLDCGGKKVYGLELGQSEHQEAESLKKRYRLASLQNIQGDCAQTLPSIKNQVELIIVDPPRAGCSQKVLASIDESAACELVYISCNHASFARDVGRLKNFVLDQVEIFDMFPKTANFEIFSHLHRI